MKVSIITPSLNSEKYIENNLKSVHLHPKNDNLSIEQIIVDGSSTDRTIDIVESFREKYSADIKIIQGKDKNMYDAINKGLKLINGDIWACLNTDDLYYPETVNLAVEIFNKNPDLDVVYGYLDFIDEDGKFMYTLYVPTFDLDYFVLKVDCFIISQPATFFRRQVIDKVGYFDISFKYASDYEYFIRVGAKCKLKLIKKSFTQYRKHSESITCNEKTNPVSAIEASRISKKYIGELGIKQKNLFFGNFYFYILQFKFRNTNHIVSRINEISKQNSWKQFIKDRILH